MNKQILVVYKSVTGFTKQYAEWIAEKLNCSAVELKKVSAETMSEYKTIIFGGRFHAGFVDGLKNAKALFEKSTAEKLIVFASGATPNSATEMIEEAWKNNLTTEEMDKVPHFYMQGGLEEVGWRWYLQTHISIKKSFVLKMLVISVIWFIWHFPIYRLPWITAGSSNYLIFFLMILGNTFTLGAVKELSRGSIPCILAHMLIDTAAVTMLVGSNLTKVALLVGVEIILSVILVGILGRRQKQQSQV